MLDDELLQILGVVQVSDGGGGGGGSLGSVLEDGLQLGGQGVVLVLVENDLEELLGLVEGAHGVVLGHVLCAKAHVGSGVVELEGIDHAALHGGNDLATGQLGHGHAHLLEKVGGQANGAVLEALELSSLLRRCLLKPAQGLRGHGEGEEAHNVEVHLGRELVPELLATTGVNPGETNLRGGTAHRAGTEERGALVLAIPVARHMVAAIENALANGIDDLEGLDHSTCGQVLEFEAAAGHFVDAGDISLGHFGEDLVGTPGTLNFERYGGLCNRDHGEAGNGRCNGSSSGLAEELTATGLGRSLIGNCLHFLDFRLRNLHIFSLRIFACFPNPIADLDNRPQTPEVY